MFICPKCGKIPLNWTPDTKCCDFCETSLIDMGEEINGENIRNGVVNNWLFHKTAELERFKQKLFRKYVYPSPEFDEVLFERRQKIDDDEMQKSIQEWAEAGKKRDMIHCPQCNSTQIQAVPRKWGLFAGILTNKVDKVCLKCGKKF